MYISKNVKTKNENILVIGAPGCGKTRFFIEPFIAQSDDYQYIVFSQNASSLRFLNDRNLYENEKIDDIASISKDIDNAKNIFINTNCTSGTFLKSENCMRNIIKLLIDKDISKPIYFIIDESGCYDFIYFLNENVIKILNNKSIFFIFAYQNLSQIDKRMNLTNICSSHLFMGGMECNTLDFYEKMLHVNSLYDMSISNCGSKSKFGCMIDEKLEPIKVTKMKELRTKAGISQGELADLSDVTLRNIRAIENDIFKIQKMKAISLYKISQVLKCSMEELMELC